MEKLNSSGGKPNKLVAQGIQVAHANVGGVSHPDLACEIDDDLVNERRAVISGNEHPAVRTSKSSNKVDHNEHLESNEGGYNTELGENVRTETMDLIEPARKLALDIAAIGIPVLPLFEKINEGKQHTNWQEWKSLEPLPGAEATADVAQINNWFEALVSVRDHVATARERIEHLQRFQQKYREAVREVEQASREYLEAKELVELGRKVRSGEIDLDTAADLLPSQYSWGTLDDKKVICQKAAQELEYNQIKQHAAAARGHNAIGLKNGLSKLDFNALARAEEEKINAAGPTDIAGVRITGQFSVLQLAACSKDWFDTNPSHFLPETFAYRDHYVFLLGKEPRNGNVGAGRIHSWPFINLTPTDEVVVRPVAPEPEWVLDAWWGEEYRGTPLDTAAAVVKAREYLAEAEQEDDKPKSAAYIGSLVREWRNEEKSEEWIREQIEELENFEPEYDTTFDHIGCLRDCGLSKARATRFISLWNQNNRPPLPADKLRELVSQVWEDTNPCWVAREQRWRYRDAQLDDGSLESLLDEPLAPDDFLMGAVLSTDQRAMLFGPSGKGKTIFALALAVHIAAGRDFLHWKGPSKPRRVLYIDGEMGKKGMQLRFEEAIRRLGARPPKGMLSVITKEQFPQLRLGLDTSEGQLWLDGFIEKAGSFDLIVFDNINSLCSGDTIGPEGWKRVDEWSLDLKAMGVGQLWLHHTGHNTSHEYGTVIRRNDMDTVVKLRPLQSTPERRSFALDFEKARFADRSPADFETVQINLADETWQTSGGSSPTGDRVELLRDVLIEHGAITEETGLSEAEFAKRLSNDPAEQKTWCNRLHVYFRREGYQQLCGLVGGKRRWWVREGEVN